MLALYRDAYFTSRFAEDRIIPRFQVEGVPVGSRINVYRIDSVSGERLGLLAQAIAEEGGWVSLEEPILVRAGEAFIAAALAKDERP